MKSILIAVLLFAFALPATALDDLLSAQEFSVMVTVTEFAEKGFVDEVHKLIKAQLNSMQDVSIIEKRESADYGLLILPTHGKTTKGADLGFGLFVLVVSPFREKDFDALVEKAGMDKEKDSALFPLRFHTTSLDHIEYLGYRAGPPGTLKTVCKRIVDTFNERCLEPRRKAMAELKMQMERLIKEHQARQEAMSDTRKDSGP